MTDEPNPPFAPNPRIAEIDVELDGLETARLRFKAQGAALMKEKARLLMADQIELRVLADRPLSGNELKWVTDNPDEWAKIKQRTDGKRGSRRALSAAVV